MSREHRSLEQVFWDIWHKLTGKQRQHEISAPWDESWKLDEEFFKDLADWDNKNQDSTFLKIVEKIKDATITCKPCLDLIPDSPFPARSIVQALSYFLNLGVTVAHAQGEVFRFADELSSWVVNIEANFEGGRGKFGSRARKNLGHIRDLVNEIFKWGWARLHDGRWEMLLHGMSVVDEIRDFKERLRTAREMFSVLQDINTAVRIERILQQIQAIKKLQKSQIGEILDHIERTQLENERRQFLERTLYRNATLDTTIKEKPHDWVNDLSEGSRNFFWLTGDPGSGKSAITASFARDCKKTGVLWAQFFINRNNESTTNPRFYFPSIACQMVEHITDATISVAIHEILRKNESLLDEMTIDQGLDFFVKVVQAACDLDRSKPVAIIFDGLDETSRKHLESTATIFSGLFTKLERDNAKVFISSRTEDEITRPFYGSLQQDSQHVKHLHLDTSGSRKDVDVYLRRNLEHLVDKWALDWELWPGEEKFRKLCDQAAGLFIWAVTVVKFFRTQLDRHGRERRNKILDIFNEKGMGDVNQLYGTIMAMTFESDADEWEYERFRWLVGFIIALKEPLTIGDLSGLLDLRETSDSDPVDTVHFVTNLRTVLVAGTENIDKGTIPRLHKSFVEYITSQRANTEFRIDIPMVDDRITAKCLRLVARLKNAKEREALPAGSIRYAVQNWTRHIRGERISESGIGLVGCDAEELWKAISTTATLKHGFLSVSGDYRTHMYDPEFGFPPRGNVVGYAHSSTIQGSNAISAIAVSPDGKLIASGDSKGAVQIWDSNSHQPIGKAGKHDGEIFSICFPPDSRWVVSGSWDKSIRMWDSQTGEAICLPLLGHTASVRCVYTDGKIVVSASPDETIRIWSCDTHQPIGTPIDVGNQAFTVALSKDGRIAAGVGGDVCIFDIGTRQKVGLMKGRGHFVWTVAFSPDGSRVASGASDGTICVWDVQTEKQTRGFDGHVEAITSIAFSPDSHWIASCSNDCSNDRTIRVWDTETGQPVCHPLIGHTGSVNSVVFSHDGQHIVSGSTDSTIRIWAASYQRPTHPQQFTTIHISYCPASPPDGGISLHGHPPVISACHSPDGLIYAASTLDGNVWVWDDQHKLLWKANILIHPIHLLQLSKTQLICSGVDGSTVSWNLVDGKPTHEKAITRGPQLEASSLHRFKSLGHNICWFPFDSDAGLWAYIDRCFIRFEAEKKSVTILDVAVGDIGDIALAAPGN